MLIDTGGVPLCAGVDDVVVVDSVPRGAEGALGVGEGAESEKEHCESEKEHCESERGRDTSTDTSWERWSA